MILTDLNFKRITLAAVWRILCVGERVRKKEVTKINQVRDDAGSGVKRW